MFDSDRTALVDGLRDGLRALVRGLDERAVGDDALLREAREVEELGRLLDAARVIVAGEIAHRSRSELGDERLSARRGCRNPGELLERVTLASASTARARMRAAESLRARTSLTGESMPAVFPLVAGALTSGAIGVDAAAAIVTALAPIRDRGVVGDADAFDAAEQELVDAATGAADTLPAGADEIAVMAKTWALFLDPDGTLPDEERALTARGITLGRERHGVVPLHGDLLPEVAAQWQRLFDAFFNSTGTDAPVPRFRADSDDPLTDDGAEADAPPDPRTGPQRRHDAFAAMLTIAAGMDAMPRIGGAPPTLVVTVSEAELRKTHGVAFVPPHGAGETGAVPAAVARHIGCAGATQRVVFDGNGRIIELGSPRRIFTAHQRRGIATRDGTCITPGCSVPAAWCEIHHVEAAARGGPTHTDNGVPLCWFHHRTIETSGWEIRMIHGVPWIRAPRWLDPTQRWRPANPSPVRRLSTTSASVIP